ncbi:MAG: hypothetical protein H8D56_03065 [Planctomycetes bacterium]|nr:hypothetical protein [Planctomycetota bacterium]
MGILFNFENGFTYSALIAEMNNFDFVIGLHVQGTDTPEGSEGYIHTPIPPSMVIGLLGMGIAGIKLRKYA